MNRYFRPLRTRPRFHRQGFSAVETVLCLAVAFVMAMVLYYMGERSLGNLYQVISAVAGSPYL